FDAEYVNTRESGFNPDADPMLMMLPDLRSTMYFPNTWQANINPLRFTVRIRSISSAGMSKKGVAEFTPAPFTSTSTAPNFATTSASSFSSAVFDVVSQEKNSDFPPSLAIRSIRPFALVTSRPTSATVAPALANASEMAPHNSPVPPITTATLPLRENNSAGFFMLVRIVPNRSAKCNHVAQRLSAGSRISPHSDV